MYIYLTTHKETGRAYVGLSRFESKDTARYLGSGLHLKRAIKKHGRAMFEKTILEDGITDHDVLAERERYWIREKQTRHPNGYNLTAGGDGCVGFEWDEASKKRVQMGQPHRKDIVQIDLNTGRAVAEYPTVAAAARAVDGETSNIGACFNQTRRIAYGYHWMVKSDFEALGSQLSPEALATLHEVRGPDRTPEYWAKVQVGQPHRKIVLQIDPQTDAVLNEYPTITAAGRSQGGGMSAISLCLSKDYRSAYGYIWMEKREYETPEGKALAADLCRMERDGVRAPMSEEQKMKLRFAQPAGKAVVQLDAAGAYLATYATIGAAAEATGMTYSYVMRSANHNLKLYAGYGFLFETEYEALKASGAQIGPFVAPKREPTVARSIVRFDPVTKACLGVYPSCSQAARAVDVSTGGVIQCAKGLQKTVGGHSFMYQSDFEALQTAVAA